MKKVIAILSFTFFSLAVIAQKEDLYPISIADFLQFKKIEDALPVPPGYTIQLCEVRISKKDEILVTGGMGGPAHFANLAKWLQNGYRLCFEAKLLSQKSGKLVEYKKTYVLK